MQAVEGDVDTWPSSAGRAHQKYVFFFPGMGTAAIRRIIRLTFRPFDARRQKGQLVGSCRRAWCGGEEAPRGPVRNGRAFGDNGLGRAQQRLERPLPTRTHPIGVIL